MALALKYRPQSFQDLVGQINASRSLKNAIEHDRISHAYLFFGARGVGKTSMARILARALNCSTNGPSVNPCGECENCKDIASGQSMDVVEMDAASNRGIDNIRDLRENIRFAPMKSKYRIYIIDEVHMLTNESFNALLKTLEEPPAHVVFIMATTEIHKIPDTIISRCQTFSFRKFSIEDIRGRLLHILKTENIEFEEEATYHVAQRAEGSMRDAISILDQVVAYTGGEKLTAKLVLEALGISSAETRLHFLESLRRREVRDALAVINELHQEGQNLRRFIWDALAAMKDLALFHHETSANPGGMFSSSQIKLLRDYAARWDTHELTDVFNTLYELYAGWSQFPNSRGSEIRVSLEMSVFQIIHRLNQPSVSSLVTRLNGLKNAIESGKPFKDKPAPTSKPQGTEPGKKSPNPYETKPTAALQQTSPAPTVSEPKTSPTDDYNQDPKSILEKEFLAEPGSEDDNIFS